MRTRRSQRHAGFLLSTALVAVAITGLFARSTTEGDVVQASDRAPVTPVWFPAPVDMAAVAPHIQAAQDQALAAYLASAAYLAETHRRELHARVVAESTPAAQPAVVVHAASAAPVPGHEEVKALIRQGFARFGAAVAEQAVRVSGCETGGTYNPAVVNGSGHTGLFQLSRQYHEGRANRLGYSWDQMRQAGPNIAVAADLYEEQGWGPWTCRTAA